MRLSAPVLEVGFPIGPDDFKTVLPGDHGQVKVIPAMLSYRDE